MEELHPLSDTGTGPDTSPAPINQRIGHRPFYTFFVDDHEFRVERSTITGGEIMDLAGIPREVGLVQILDDGTQRIVTVDEVIELKPRRHFRRAPHFKRG